MPILQRRRANYNPAGSTEEFVMKRLLITVLACVALTSCTAEAPAPSIDAFFERFTADWVRMSPNQAIAARYFTGPEQDALETQMTPLTREWINETVSGKPWKRNVSITALLSDGAVSETVT